MKVFLGDMELKQSEKPDEVPLGGGQHLARKEFPGGNASIQFFGSKYRDITWTGWFEGADAYQRMLRIGNMRQKGEPVEFKTEKLTVQVVIAEFHPVHRTNMFIPFSITLSLIIGPPKKDEKKEAVDKISELLAQLAEKEEGAVQTKKLEYVVQHGDTLSKIALKYFGDANAYDKIYEDNKDILISGPHLVLPGQRLVINV